MQASTMMVAAPAPAKYTFNNATAEAVTAITVCAVNEELARRRLLRLVRHPERWFLAPHDVLIPASLRKPATGFSRCDPCDLIYLEAPAAGCCDWCGSGLSAL